MIAMILYMGAAAGLALGSQFMRPSAALGSQHHRKLYWTGAIASIGFVGIMAGALAI